MELVELTDTQEAWARKVTRDRIRITSAHRELEAAALRFVASLYGKHSPHYAEREREYIAAPESLLSAHAGVMNAKSARCKTLRQLADAVIRQAELPMRPAGHYRGQDYCVDFAAVLEKWPEE